MSKAKKLPSGKWRCQVHIKREDGSLDRTSFTASSRSEAERMARQYEAEADRYGDISTLTLSQAISSYISRKSHTLSPASVREYRRKAKRYYGEVGRIRLNKITQADLQLFVDRLAAQGLSAKSIRDIYGLASAALGLFLPQYHFKATIPQAAPRESTTPDDASVQQLIDAADPQLRLCIILSALGTMRRGEVCALRYGDVSRDMCLIRVHADMVEDENKDWIIKDMPKTAQSIRGIYYPAEVIAMIGDGDPEELVVGLNPNQVTKRFIRLRNRLGLSCRYHDLRHYAASVMESIGIPRTYIEKTGGWSKGSSVLTRTYLETMESYRIKYGERTAEHFREAVLSKNTHENTHAG